MTSKQWCGHGYGGVTGKRVHGGNGYYGGMG